MAVVLTSLVATFVRTVFVKPPDSVRGFTSMPRAIVNFSLLDATLDAKPVNDQQELIIACDLPGNLAYRFLEYNWSITQDVANDWIGFAYMELLNAVRGLPPGAVQRHAIILNDTTRIPQAGEMQVARNGDITDMPKYLIQTNPRGSPASPVITFKATNQAAAVGAAGTVDFYASFMEFDIEQVELFPVHWAPPVYIR